MIVLNEEDLDRRIAVGAQRIVEQVLNNYFNQKKSINEISSKPANKIELVKENIVKMDGKYFKLVPANVVVKPKAQA